MRSLIAALLLALAIPTAGSAATVAFGSTQAGDTGGIDIASGTSVLAVGPDLSTETTTPASDWVWSGTPSAIVATYTFQFDLTGFDVATATLNGLYGARSYANVVLNGTQLGELPFPGPNAAALTAFGTSNAALFNGGINTLTFVAVDVSTFGAFRAIATVEADAITAIPLPASGAVLILALGGAAFAMRRRKT